jgi:hypothetical protein
MMVILINAYYFTHGVAKIFIWSISCMRLNFIQCDFCQHRYCLIHQYCHFSCDKFPPSFIHVHFINIDIVVGEIHFDPHVVDFHKQ